MSKQERKTPSMDEQLAVAIEAHDVDERYALCYFRRKLAYRAFFSHFHQKTITKQNTL